MKMESTRIPYLLQAGPAEINDFFDILPIFLNVCCPNTKITPSSAGRFQKFIHVSTQNLNLASEFKTGQNHPVNKAKNK